MSLAALGAGVAAAVLRPNRNQYPRSCRGCHYRPPTSQQRRFLRSIQCFRRCCCCDFRCPPNRGGDGGVGGTAAARPPHRLPLPPAGRRQGMVSSAPLLLPLLPPPRLRRCQRHHRGLLLLPSQSAGAAPVAHCCHHNGRADCVDLRRRDCELCRTGTAAAVAAPSQYFNSKKRTARGGRGSLLYIYSFVNSNCCMY
jgi:hypothetical protein